MRDVTNFYQPWPRPSEEFLTKQREAEARHTSATYRPITEAPRDGTEIMVSDREWMIFAWRTKWCEQHGQWVRWFGDERGWIPTMGQPKYWLPKMPVRDLPPIQIYRDSALLAANVIS